MNCTDTAGRAVVAARRRIRDADLLVYRDLMMLDHRVRSGLTCRQIAAIYRVDRSLVARRLRGIPQAVVRRMREFVAEAARTGDPNLTEGQLGTLAAIARRHRRDGHGLA